MAFPPMSTEIGFGIVGAGMVARYYARAIAETPGARLAAVCRGDAARADEAAAELDVPCDPGIETARWRADVCYSRRRENVGTCRSLLSCPRTSRSAWKSHGMTYHEALSKP
jgi:hypothetical protein